MWGDEGVNESYYGNHFTAYMCTKSCYTPETYKMLHVYYISKKKGGGSKKGKHCVA